jgi:hypothetical protein
MKAGDSNGVHYHRFEQVRQPLLYQVHFGAADSPIYTLTPWIPPEVEAIDLTYHFPEYLEMPVREEPNGGEITAIEGTRVVLNAHVNKPLKSMTMVLEDSQQEIRFTQRDSLVWQGELTLNADDHYHLDLLDKKDQASPFNPRFRITTRTDQAPRIKIQFPYRDMEVSPLDEVGFEFQVSDDFGLASYGIRYEVAGREPVWLPIAEQATGVKASGYQMLALEELALEAGDLLTWTVWAKDRKPDRDEVEQIGDPFFLEIRPFKRMFMEAVSNQGGQGGAGANLVTKQKEVLIATWNLRKEARGLNQTTFAERRDIIIETQGAIGETLAQQAAMTGGGGSPDFKELTRTIDAIVDKLEKVEFSDPLPALSEATVLEQKAYRLLLRMEPEQSQVSRSQNMGANAAGGDRDPAMDELEMRRNRNFYEDEKRTREQQEAAAQTLDRIKELAQRQEMVNQEISKLISELEREEIDEKEFKRRLERLQEEAKKNIEELDEVRREVSTSQMDNETSQRTQQQLDETRQEMNHTLEQLQDDQLQQARSAGSQASSKLDDLERELEREARGSTEERMQDVQRQVAELQEMQREIQEEVTNLGQQKDSPSLTGDDPEQSAKAEVMERKRELSEKFRDMIEDAADISETARASQEHLSRKLGDWLRETSREGIGEDIEETQKQLQYGVWDELDQKEEAIAEKLDRIGQRFERVVDQMAGDDLEAQEKALAELQQLQQQNRQQQAQGRQPGRGNQGDEQTQQSEELEQMEAFVEEDYREWLERIRNAEGLLGDSTYSPPLSRMRREIEKMRRRFKRDNLIPRFDMFQELVARPLNATVTELARDLEARRQNRQFIMQDEGSVPDQYRESVSEYFQLLSESEGN